MSGQTSIGGIAETEFARLLQTLSATPKGRRFLAEYRRRARPQETSSLIDALQRIESTVAGMREQLQPASIADELRRIAMTLEIAMDGVSADPDGDEMERRSALVVRAQDELAVLAASLGGGQAER